MTSDQYTSLRSNRVTFRDNETTSPSVIHEGETLNWRKQNGVKQAGKIANVTLLLRARRVQEKKNGMLLNKRRSTSIWSCSFRLLYSILWVAVSDVRIISNRGWNGGVYLLGKQITLTISFGISGRRYLRFYLYSELSLVCSGNKHVGGRFSETLSSTVNWARIFS